MQLGTMLHCSEIRSHPGQRRAWLPGPELVLGLLAGLVAASWVLPGCSPGCDPEPTSNPLPPLPAGLVARGYTGSEACEPCHEEEARQYRDTGHARSAWSASQIPGLAASLQLPAEVDHPASGFRYSVNLEAGRLVVRESYDLPGGQRLRTMERSARLTVGSGRLTFTSIWGRDILLASGPAVELFQLPVTRYTSASFWDMSPGYDRPDHLRFDRGISERCMFCHNGMMEPVPGRAYAFRPPLAHGIGCERCHGPGRRHVLLHEEEGEQADGAARQAGQDPIVNPENLPPERAMDICCSCHLEGRARVLRRGRKSIYEYRPGEPLGDHLYVFAQQDSDPEIFTHSSHGERFLLSRCVKESSGRLVCAHCHEGHRPSPRDPSPYNAVCMRCHAAESCSRRTRTRAERKGPKDPCTDCHMVWGGTSDIPHVSTIDHWIRRPSPDRLPGQEAVPDPTEHGVHPHHRGSRRLVLLTEPVSRPDTPGERAGAFAQAYLEYGHGVDDPRIIKLALAAVRRALAVEPGRASLWRSLAQAQEMAGQQAAACRALQQAAALEREDPGTWVMLGICRASNGRLTAARTAFAEALRLDPRSTEALNRMGFLEFARGKPERAIELYLQVLKLDPELSGTHHNRAVLHLGQGDLAQAETSWRRAVQLDPTRVPAVEGLREVLARQGKAAEALLFARQAARLRPEDLEAQRRLAGLALAAGEKDLARKALGAEIELAPDDAGLREEPEGLSRE